MLTISDLRTSFSTPEGDVKAVDSINFSIRKGERVALIGETGCGKTVFGMSIVRLLPSTAKTSGAIRYNGDNLLQASEDQMRKVRGNEIAYILQNPSVSLNPLMRVGQQIEEAIQTHHTIAAANAREKALYLLKCVNFSDPSTVYHRYAHELSGGMKQKVMIAMGIAADPALIIADEPTKSLDRNNKQEILSLLTAATTDSSLIMITHDLAAASQICDRIQVMYAGEIVEEGPSKQVLHDPLHPYTRAFMQAHPRMGCKAIPGSSPSLINLPEGCRFFPRCERAEGNHCQKIHPELHQKHGGRSVRCHCH